MKKLGVFLVAVVMCGSVQARERATMHRPYPALMIGSDVIDTEKGWTPDGAFTLQQLADVAGLNPTRGLGVRVRVVTTPVAGDVPRPVRDFSNPAFLALHPRYSAGLFTVKLFRTHTYLHPSATEIASGNTVSECSTQSFTIPAQAGQDVTTVVDMSKFSQPSDALIFELWPGYDYHVEVLTSGGTWRYVAGIGLPQSLPVGQFIGYAQVPPGDCTRE